MRRHRSLRSVPAPGRHRQRQDRGLPPCRGSRTRSRAAGAAARAGDRADAAVGGNGSGALPGDSHRQSAQRTQGDRPAGKLARRAVRCGASRPRYKARRVHAHAATRSDRVDEEHDGSLKQTAGFCYSARDLAVSRAHQRDLPVVLGPRRRRWRATITRRTGATSFSSCRSGSTRARPASTASHSTVDTRRAASLHSCWTRSANVFHAATGVGSINRRGYAPVLDAATAAGFLAAIAARHNSSCTARRRGCIAITADTCGRSQAPARSAESRI